MGLMDPSQEGSCQAPETLTCPSVSIGACSLAVRLDHNVYELSLGALSVFTLLGRGLIAERHHDIWKTLLVLLWEVELVLLRGASAPIRPPRRPPRRWLPACTSLSPTSNGRAHSCWVEDRPQLCPMRGAPAGT